MVAALTQGITSCDNQNTKQFDGVYDAYPFNACFCDYDVYLLIDNGNMQIYGPHGVLHEVGRIENDPSVFYPCFAWRFLTEEDGGAIATIGASRSAYTWVDSNGVHGGAGYLDLQFFKAYEEHRAVGMMLTLAQNEYINNVYRDYFTIEEYMLIGDPSLAVGGLPLL